MMQVINDQKALIAKLLTRQNALYLELNKRFSSSGSSSGSVDKQANGTRISGYRELNNQDISGSGSPLNGSSSDARNGVKIIQGESNAPPHVATKR